MKMAKLDSFLLKILYLLAAGIIVCLSVGKSGLASMLFYITFPVTVLLWLRSVRKTLKGMDLLVLGAIGLAAASVLIDAGLNNADLGFSYIKKWIIFSMTLLFMQTAYRIQVDRNLVRFITWLVDLLTVFLIGMFFLRTSLMFTLNGRISNYLTFRIGNPNLTGLFLTTLYMLQIYRVFTPERWYIKLYHIILAVCLVGFILLTQSRNCLVATVVYTLVCVWLILRSRRNLRIRKGGALLAAMLPFLFMVAYTILIYTPWIQRVFSFLVGEGKSLDSRVEIWLPALEHLQRSPAIGAYFGISNGTGMSQMHNSHLDIAASYGIPVLILVCLLLRNYIYQDGRVYENKQNFVFMLAFICAIILGIGEAALFSGGLGLYVFVGTFLMLSRRIDETETIEKL